MRPPDTHLTEKYSMHVATANRPTQWHLYYPDTRPELSSQLRYYDTIEFDSNCGSLLVLS